MPGAFLLDMTISFTTVIAAAVGLALSHQCEAASIRCMLGTTRCIKSQGTEIPSEQALEILDRCEDFTQKDLGRLAMRLSAAEAIDRSSGKITPLLLAWHAYGYLIASPLAFERKRKSEDVGYPEIKRACLTLERDFNSESKWTN